MRDVRAGGPRLAIVIPCFNDGETLMDAVRSAQAQEPAEIVVVDDGSTDAQTLAVFDELRGAGLTVIRQKNSGVAAARMAGVAATTAPYVFALDADDELVPGALTALADYLDERPDVQVVWGRLRYFGGERTHDKLVAEELDPWLVTYLNDMPVSSLVRRSVLLDAGGWQLTVPYEDWDLWMALAERGARGYGLPTTVYRYRIHGVRMWASAAKRFPELYALLRSRHPALFAARSRMRRLSPAPLAVRLLLPAIDRLWPGTSYQKSLLMARVFHVASGRGGFHRPFVRRLRRLLRLLPRRRAVAKELAGGG